MQQQLDSKDATKRDTVGDGESSEAPPEVTLFGPTSKYHPDRSGLARRRRWLVVDFDGTCTEHDTTPLLPRLAALAARQRSSNDMNGDESAINGNGDDLGRADAENSHKEDLDRRLGQFQELEDEFMRRFMEAKSTLLTDNKPGNIEEEQSIHDILDALDEPSNVVTRMVSESRVLEGLGHASVNDMEGMLRLHGVSSTSNESEVDISERDESVGEHKVETTTNNFKEGDEFDKITVRLRHGCESTLARILLANDEDANRKEQASCEGWSLAVLSINWCPALIDASLVQPVLRKRRNILCVDSCETEEIPIWSNHVDGDGTVSLHVPGALAKRDRIAELRRHIRQSEGSSTIVYVGDSSTDLAALLEADIGIIMGHSGSMTLLAERWGIQIVPSKHRSQHGFGNGSSHEDMSIWREKKILWQVESWQEIDEMLLEIDGLW